MIGTLEIPPEAITPRQRRIAVATAIAVALTRIAAIARTPWDWDEALFAAALRDYNVVYHNPHPPGFPLFIAAARLATLVASDFRALQIVTLCGAAVLFPLMLFFSREIRLYFWTAFTASIFLCFFPNIWFYGGTAFSDIPSLALSLGAAGLLLRGCRSTPAYLWGAFALGVAAGFRPQNLLIGLLPALLSTWAHLRRPGRRRAVVMALAVGAVTLLVSYGGAAVATGGWREYAGAVRAHQQYIATVDSIRNPSRPSLIILFDDFFIRPYRMERVNIALAVLSAIGILQFLRTSRLSGVLVFGAFAPFAVLGWLMLDHLSVSRFSLAWAPLVAVVAAHGLGGLGEAIARLSRSDVAGRVVQAAVAGWLTLTMAVWVFPALTTVRRHPSPPLQAIEWIRTHLPKGTELYIHGSMGPYAHVFLQDYRRIDFEDDGQPLPFEDRKAWVLREGASNLAGARNFVYPLGRLWNLVRQRYFAVSLVPLASQVKFAEGWYDEEGFGEQSWRWMGRRASLLLPPLAGRARLTIRCYVPLDALPAPPTVTVRINDQIDRFVARESVVTRHYVVQARSDAPNAVQLETDGVVTPASAGLSGDTRALGLRLEGVSWSRAQ